MPARRTGRRRLAPEGGDGGAVDGVSRASGDGSRLEVPWGEFAMT